MKTLILMAIIVFAVQPPKPQKGVGASKDNPAPNARDSKPANSKTSNAEPASPAVVIGNQATAADSRQNEKQFEQNAELQRRLIRYTFWLVVAGFATAAIICWQSIETRRSANAAGDSAGHAARTAKLTELSMIASNRAYVHYGGVRYLSHYFPDISGYRWTIRPRWHNHGNTPTRDLLTGFNFALRDAPLPADFNFPLPKKHAATIPPHGDMEASRFLITGDDLQAIKDLKKILYIWGEVTYRDVFPDTRPHVTKFCQVTITVMGNPRKEWNADKNPVEIMFVNNPVHNTSDEGEGDQEAN